MSRVLVIVFFASPNHPINSECCKNTTTSWISLFFFTATPPLLINLKLIHSLGEFLLLGRSSRIYSDLV